MLKDKNVIITGCKRGIGRAMIEVFAANGANIYAHARSADDDFLTDMASTAMRHGVEIWPLCFELTDTIAMKLAVKKLMSEKRPLHGLVNNAGITLNALFQMTTEQALRQQFEVNFFALFNFTQAVSKLMVRQRQGSIVNIASTAAQDGNAGKSAYGASKAAVIALTQSIAAELGDSGIRANCIAPGITDTDMLETMPAAVIELTRNQTDLRRLGNPTNIADAAVFLVSELSSYVTGQTLRVDGGLR
ncbi:SDR family oxidoreductase [Enterobacteriaceae bacterium H4N4]|uniref:SDR family oxidoreductase n=1 Tax=Silvania confinis TaxID=2926470 RepID=A0A9J6QIK2_9ENTR|nr:SDR family NAD(P)-dependent oxidoreductase [Silvania confinis]MCU6670075.1 SDR family oxidoreductase [Silvania confinis]